MDRIKRSGCQEVECAGDAQVHAMMLERLVGEVSDVEPDRVRAELQEQPAHPRLELRGLQARDWRPAGARPAGDVEDGLAAGATEYIAKPVSLSHLIRLIGRLASPPPGR